MSGRNITSVAIVHVAIFTIFLINHIAFSADDPAVIPAELSQLDAWFTANVKPYTDRKATLDPELAKAEEKPRVIKVNKDGSGEFKTINDAINSIPSGNTQRIILSIGNGQYQEKVKIERTKPFITLYGSPDSMPNVTFGGTAKEYGTVDSATLIVESDYFMAANIIIVNSAPKPDGKREGAQAVAARISGDKAAFYNTKFVGFQDTLCDDKGNHFFKDCHIEGTVDFIFGSGKSLYLNTELQPMGESGLSVITAQARKTTTEDNGFAFVHCKIAGTGNGTYLGRAWMDSPHVVYAYTTMGNIVHPEGWTDNAHPERHRTIFYGEYKCSGPGANPATRAKYTKQLTDAEVKPYLVLDYIQGPKWILPPPKV